MKICKKCGTPKVLEDFTLDAQTRDGRRPYCRDCGKEYWNDYTAKNKDKRNARAKELRQTNVLRYRQQVRRSELKTKYGLTPERFEKLREEQSNCCACCGDEFTKTPHIDHVHGSDPIIVRGLLCNSCNNGIGRFKDSVVRLQKAIGYLEQFS